MSWTRIAAIGITGGLLLAAVGIVWIGFTTRAWGEDIGGDFVGYLNATRSWLAGDGFYLQRQLQGPYQIEIGDVLYPPTVLWLLVPFTVLPAVLWWVVPVGLVSWLTWRWRPSMVAWPFSLRASRSRSRRTSWCAARRRSGSLPRSRRA